MRRPRRNDGSAGYVDGEGMEDMTNREAVVNFKASILARRRLLKFLFDSVLPNLEYVQSKTEGSEEVTTAQWMSQDCANALILIVGYSLERFLPDAGLVTKPDHTRREFHDVLEKLGVESYHGVKLGSAIVALGDQARHLHEPQAGKSLRSPTKDVLDALCLGETHDQAAAQFLQNLQKNNPVWQSYAAFENGLLAIANDAERP